MSGQLSRCLKREKDENARTTKLREQNLKRIDELIANKQRKIDSLFAKQETKSNLDEIIALKCDLVLLQTDRLQYLSKDVAEDLRREAVYEHVNRKRGRFKNGQEVKRSRSKSQSRSRSLGRKESCRSNLSIRNRINRSPRKRSRNRERRKNCEKRSPIRGRCYNKSPTDYRIIELPSASNNDWTQQKLYGQSYDNEWKNKQNNWSLAIPSNDHTKPITYEDMRIMEQKQTDNQFSQHFSNFEMRSNADHQMQTHIQHGSSYKNISEYQQPVKIPSLSPPTPPPPPILRIAHQEMTPIAAESTIKLKFDMPQKPIARKPKSSIMMPFVKIKCWCGADELNRFWPENKDQWYDDECQEAIFYERKAWQSFEMQTTSNSYELYRIKKRETLLLFKSKGTAYRNELRQYKIDEFFYRIKQLSTNNANINRISKVLIGKCFDAIESFANNRLPAICKCFTSKNCPWYDVECEVVCRAHLLVQLMNNQKNTPETNANLQEAVSLMERILNNKKIVYEMKLDKFQRLNNNPQTIKIHDEQLREWLTNADVMLTLSICEKIAQVTSGVDGHHPNNFNSIIDNYTATEQQNSKEFNVNNNMNNFMKTINLSKPWYDDECDKMLFEYKRLLMEYEKSQSIELHSKCKVLQKTLEKIYKKKRILYEKSIVNNKQQNQCNAVINEQKTETYPEWYDSQCRNAVDAVKAAQKLYENDQNEDNLAVLKIREKQKDQIFRIKCEALETKKQSQQINQSTSSMVSVFKRISPLNDNVLYDQYAAQQHNQIRDFTMTNNDQLSNKLRSPNIPNLLDINTQSSEINNYLDSQWSASQHSGFFLK